jgi:AcrR family transcriptional regulator
VLSLDRILGTAIALGLDRFSVAGVARDLGVTDMAIYRYVRSRDDLYARAAARAHATFPEPRVPPGWQDYLVEVADHAWHLAHRHPGIERYLLDGPYHPETLAAFDASIGRLRALAPEFGPEEAYVLLSRVTSVALAAADNALSRRYQEDPDRPGELFGWTVRALVEGMAGLLARGVLPANRAALSLGQESAISPSPS